MAEGFSVFDSIVRDREFAMPKHEWMIKVMPGASKLFFHAIENCFPEPEYKEEENDCDDFTEDFRFWMRRAWRRTPKAGDAPRAILCGELHYSVGGNHKNRHDVAWTITKPDGGPARVMVIEPQRLASGNPEWMLRLSPAEKASSTLIF